MKRNSLAPLLIVLLLATAAAAQAGEFPRLVKVYDGSEVPPSSGGSITFLNVGYPDGPNMVLASANPLIAGRNLYGVDLVRHDDGTTSQWYNYHGAWKDAGQVNDYIYLSKSADLDPTSAWTDPAVVIDSGSYDHVNDPTLAIDGNDTWHMLYTAAKWVDDATYGNYFRDWINYSYSNDGETWTPSTGTTSAEISMSDPSGLVPGTLTSIARPSLVETDSGWKLWFDGKTQNQTDGGVHSYLAHSVDGSPTEFEVVYRYDDIPGFPGFYEPDVQLRSDGTYLAVVQRGFNELWTATSTDGIHFDFADDPAVDADYPFYSRERISNPGLVYDQIDDVNYGLGFGMAGEALTDHDIGFAVSQYQIEVRSPATTPGGDPVWHVYSAAASLTEQTRYVFNFTEFDLVRVRNPVTGEVILEQDFSDAHQHDQWLLELGTVAPLPGDLNEDGFVGSADLDIVRANWGATVTPGTSGDADGDGVVNSGDLDVVRANWGAGGVAVPEPGVGVSGVDGGGVGVEEAT